jgi:hypothetical protein
MPATSSATDRDGLARSEPTATTPTAAVRQPVRRRDELLKHDLGDNETVARGSPRTVVSAHRIIIPNALGGTCGRQRPG